MISRKNTGKAIFFVGLLFLSRSPLTADVPNRIVYQGRLSKSGISAFGVHQFKACLVTDGAVTVPWCQDTSLNVTITGDFTLVLEPPSTLDWLTNSYRLSLTVDGDQLSPADQFASVPYALVAQSALSVAGGSIGGGSLADGSITDVKIAANAAIQPSKIALSPTASLANWSSPLNPALIDPTKLDGNAPIGQNTVNGDSVIDGSIRGTDIDTGTVTRDNLDTASFQTAGAGLVPRGAILIMTGACPAGYTEYAALKNRFPIGADTPEPSQTAGVDPDIPDTEGNVLGTKYPSHRHAHSGNTDSVSLPHTHGISPQYLSTSASDYFGGSGGYTGGSFSSSGIFKLYGQVGILQFDDQGSITDVSPHAHGGATSGVLGGSLSHGHPFTTAEGNAAEVSSAGAHIPPALTVRFCQKD
jgi:hypothetical protein